MKLIKLGEVLENAARLAGRQVSTLGVPEAWRAIAALAVDEGMRKIAAEKFPMMRRVEYRRYRPDWDAKTNYNRGNEVWANGRYWRAKKDSPYGEPGTSDGWKALEMSEVAAFIAWDQPWENTVIDKAGVDTNRFAYEADPKYNPTAKTMKIVGMNEMGVVLQAPAPEGVYCVFVPVFPRVSFMEWDEEKEYEPGDCAYMTQTKEVYQLIEEVEPGTSPKDDPQHWDKVRVPVEVENFLVKWIVPDFMTEEQSKYQSRASAEKEFETLCDRYIEGNGENKIRTGRCCR